MATVARSHVVGTYFFCRLMSCTKHLVVSLFTKDMDAVEGRASANR